MQAKFTRQNTQVTPDATAAMSLLRAPKFFRKFLDALQRNGLVGEEGNALVAFIVANSRLLPKPLCLFVKGPSGIGKNHLVDSVFEFLPASAVHTFTSASLRSWNYMNLRLAHKVVYIKERNEASGSAHPARLLISEKELVHWVTTKRHGRFVSKKTVTKGPIAAVSTTTKDRVQVDDETRHISIWLDDSPEQTQRIMEATLEAASPLDGNEMNAWLGLQKLLEKRAGLPIEFPKWCKGLVHLVRRDTSTARRYFQAFLQACRTVALIRSFRRDESQLTLANTIMVTFTDIAITILIFSPVFTQSISRAAEEDMDVQQQVRLISNRNGGKPVRAADLSASLGVSVDRAYALLRRAVCAGAIMRVNGRSQANLKLYLPVAPTPFLPDPETIIRNVSGTPARAKFVHPITGEWVQYRRPRTQHGS